MQTQLTISSPHYPTLRPTNRELARRASRAITKPMPITSFHQLINKYLDEHLTGKASEAKMRYIAGQWILTLPEMPKRTDLLARMKAICAGDFSQGATKANTEIALIRAACRWGAYQERWQGGDPTLGIKKFKTPKRERQGKKEELKKLLHYFERATTDLEIRDRALFGLMLFTGCRPSEARTALNDAITPYGEMVAWLKGKTKTGQPQEVPGPRQYVPWLESWRAIRPLTAGRYLFVGCEANQPLTNYAVRHRWHEIRLMLGIHGLWNYDLRRTLACTMGNELHEDAYTIRAILNHHDGSALGHYYVKSFDSLTTPIQRYAEWLWALKGEKR